MIGLPGVIGPATLQLPVKLLDAALADAHQSASIANAEAHNLPPRGPPRLSTASSLTASARERTPFPGFVVVAWAGCPRNGPQPTRGD